MPKWTNLLFVSALLASACEPSKVDQPPTNNDMAGQIDMADVMAPDMASPPDLAPSAALTVTVNDGHSRWPSSKNYLLGTVDQAGAVFNLCPTGDTDVTISSITVSAWHLGANALWIPRKVKLIDLTTGVQVGAESSSFAQDATNPQYGKTVFAGLTRKYQKGQPCSPLEVRTDFGSYEDIAAPGQTGQQLRIAILPGDVSAMDSSTGNAVAVDIINNNAVDGTLPGAYGPLLAFYRAKLLVRWTAASTSHNCSMSSQANLDALEFTNLVNVGNYLAAIKAVNVELKSLKTAANDRGVWFRTNNAAGLLLGTYTFNSGSVLAGLTTIEELSFNDKAISPGSNVQVWLGMDTLDFTKPSNVLSYKIPENGIIWSDGVSSINTIDSNDGVSTYRTCLFN